MVIHAETRNNAIRGLSLLFMSVSRNSFSLLFLVAALSGVRQASNPPLLRRDSIPELQRETPLSLRRRKYPS